MRLTHLGKEGKGIESRFFTGIARLTVPVLTLAKRRKYSIDKPRSLSIGYDTSVWGHVHLQGGDLCS